MMTKLEYTAHLAKLNSLKYFKDLDKSVRTLHKNLMQSLNPYHIEGSSMDEFMSYVHQYKLLTLGVQLVEKTYSTTLPKFIVTDLESIHDEILNSLFKKASDTYYGKRNRGLPTYELFMFIFEFDRELQPPTDLGLLLNLNKVVGDKALPCELQLKVDTSIVDWALAISDTTRCSSNGVGDLVALITLNRYRILHLDSNKKYTVWSMLIEHYTNRVNRNMAYNAKVQDLKQQLSMLDIQKAAITTTIEMIK